MCLDRNCALRLTTKILATGAEGTASCARFVNILIKKSHASSPVSKYARFPGSRCARPGLRRAVPAPKSPRDFDPPPRGGLICGS